MEAEAQASGESGLERFKKNLAALLQVPKAEIDALGKQRVKKPRRKPKHEPD